MKLVVKRLVIEWYGLDGGLQRPIWAPSGRGPPVFGGKVKLVVKSLVIEWPGLNGVSGVRFGGLPEGVLQDPEEK